MERLSGSRIFLLLVILVSALAGAAGYALVARFGGGTPLDPARARVEGIVREYVLAHPEIIPEAMDRLRDNEAAKAVAENRTAIVQPYAAAWMGNPKGDVTITEFYDYNCGFCRAVLPTLEKLVATDPGVRIVFRELPILAAESGDAARLSLAAAEQGKFLPFHNALYAAGRVTPQTLDAAAAAAGLDRARAAAAAESPRVAGEIDANSALAGKLGMTGTPAWVIGDKTYSGALSYEALVDAVKDARAARRS